MREKRAQMIYVFVEVRDTCCFRYNFKRQTAWGVKGCQCCDRLRLPSENEGYLQNKTRKNANFCKYVPKADWFYIPLF